jgi:alkylation response protein AidB-like acyl-CoA dehydrogenase
MPADTASVTPAHARAAALGAPWNEGAGARALGLVLDHAALIAEVTETGAAQTAARTRRQQHGNTERAADDPQFLRVLADSAARSAVASAATDSLLQRAETGTASVEDAELIAAGLAPLSRDAVRALFETLGASSTLTEHGLHLFWTRLHELDAR